MYESSGLLKSIFRDFYYFFGIPWDVQESEAYTVPVFLRYFLGEITISSKMIHVFQYHTMTYYIILCTFTI